MKSRLLLSILVGGLIAVVPASLWADAFDEQMDEARSAQKRGEYVRAIVYYNTAALQALTPEREAAMYIGRGEAYWLNGEFERAIDDWSEAIRANPKNADAFNNRATAYYQRGEYKKAIADYQQAAELSPALGLNGLAWVLATCPDASLRDGKKAVEHARESCDRSDWKDWRYIDTLAAAHAEVGEFDRAIEYAKQAITMPSLRDEDRALMQEHLASFGQRKPLREGAKP